MNPTTFSLLKVSKYQVKLKPKHSTRLPVFLGSTLRGAFGHALKDTVCIVNHRNCEKCIVANKCSYPYLFETTLTTANSISPNNQQLPHPFILSPPLNLDTKPGDYQQLTTNDELVFDLTLVGQAIDYLPYIIYSISKMAERGLGLAHRTSFELCQVLAFDGESMSLVYDGQTQKLLTTTIQTTLADLVQARMTELLKNDFQEIHLQFITPTRIREGGKLRNELSFPLLMRNLLRRVSLLCQFHSQELWKADFRELLNLAEGVQTKVSSLTWWDFERFSNRQQTHMKLGGFIGTTIYTGTAIAKLLPLIVAGEILHIGGSTSFGLGKYKIID